MLEYYQQFLNVLLGWFDAPLRKLILHLQEWTNIRWRLNPGWKHVFVLMWLYFSSDAKANWSTRKPFATFTILLGGVIALASTIATGIEASASSNLISAALPMAGLVVFELVRGVWSATFSFDNPSYDASGKSWREIFAYCFYSYALPILVLGAIVLAAGWVVERQGLMSREIDSAMLVLSAFVVVLAFYWLARGAFRATYERMGGELWIDRFGRSRATYLGALLLTTMGGAVLFVGLNAGLKQIGL
jgi:hypothetical protein